MKDLAILILAGGLGTRLRSVVSDVPKSLAPIRGIPFLCYILDWLVEQNFSGKVNISVGYNADLVITQIGEKYKSLYINYCLEKEPLGTGGAIKH